MSLPVRRPPSRSELSSPDHNQPHSRPSADNKAQTPQRQTPKPFAPPANIAAMSQTTIHSSPLSSLPSTCPETVVPPRSSPPTQSSPVTPTRIASSPKSRASTVLAQHAESAVQSQSSPSTISNTAKKRAPQPPTKRGREDDEEDSPRPKKATSSSEVKAKAKPAPKRSVTKKAPPKKPAGKKPAAKKPAPPPPPPSNRPSRNRKAPERFENFEEVKPIKQLPVKKGASKVFDPVFITTNSTSRLGKADVYHMLLEPSAWTSLSTEQQTKLVSMLPKDAANAALLTKIEGGDTEDTRPRAFTLSNDCFRTDVAKFKEDLKNGHLAKTWQTAARQAIIERAAGEYDAWKADEAELWWGQKSNTS